MPNAFWCIVEDDRNGSPKKVMAEVLGEAARLAPGRVEAVWLTDKASDAGQKQLGEWGASRVLLLENAAFAPYRSEVWTAAAAELAAKESPAAIFAPVTSRQREFAARLAAKLGVGLSADSVRFAMEGDKLVATRPVYAGKLLSRVTWAKSPWVATLRPNVFRPAEAQPGKTASVERPSLTAAGAQMKFVERREEVSTGLPELTEAETVISGGRGMKGPENYVILEELGRVIGAAVGASGSLFTATMTFEVRMPARCCMAPDTPKPRYSLGEIVRPVWPIWNRCGRQPASTAAREAPTAAPMTRPSSSRMT